jgi:sulfur carrier protein ThiS
VRVHLKLFATLGDHLPAELDGQRRQGNELLIEVADGTAVQEVIDRFRLPAALVHLVLVNGVYIPPGERATRRLAVEDALAIWPPVAGG